jgi:hypothetical protein
VRIFNAKIMDKRLEGDGSGALVNTAWGALLVRAETLKFTCALDQIANSPTVSVDLGGASQADFNNAEYLKTLVTAGPLSASTTLSAVYSLADGTWPPPKYIIVLASLSGTDARARVQLWVCGRGPEPVEAAAPAASSFASQLAAARMCDDEDRIAGSKRRLRAGASLFYPPEVLQPGLKWDR